MRNFFIKRIISILLVVILISAIFVLSAMERKDSALFTRKILKNILSISFIKDKIEKADTYNNSTNNTGLDSEAKNETTKSNDKDTIEKIAYKNNNKFRKIMHSFEYSLLCILILNALEQFNVSRKALFICALLLCFSFACFDEFHQLFVKGRAGQFSDVVIDTIGATIGVILYWIISKIKLKS